MSDLKQCPYDTATKCRMTHPCKLCDTYIRSRTDKVLDFFDGKPFDISTGAVNYVSKKEQLHSVKLRDYIDMRVASEINSLKKA